MITPKGIIAVIKEVFLLIVNSRHILSNLFTVQLKCYNCNLSWKGSFPRGTRLTTRQIGCDKAVTYEGETGILEPDTATIVCPRCSVNNVTKVTHL